MNRNPRKVHEQRSSSSRTSSAPQRQHSRPSSPTASQSTVSENLKNLPLFYKKMPPCPDPDNSSPPSAWLDEVNAESEKYPFHMTILEAEEIDRIYELKAGEGRSVSDGGTPEITLEGREISWSGPVDSSPDESSDEIEEEEDDDDVVEDTMGHISNFALKVHDFEVEMIHAGTFISEAMRETMTKNIVAYVPNYMAKKSHQLREITLPSAKLEFEFKKVNQEVFHPEIMSGAPYLYHAREFDGYYYRDALLVALTDVSDSYRSLLDTTRRICPKNVSWITAWNQWTGCMVIDALARFGNANAYCIWKAAHERLKFPAKLPLDYYLSIFNIFRPKRVLDIYAGLGGGVLGAAASGAVHYIGIEPNHNMEEGHRCLSTYLEKNGRIEIDSCTFIEKDPRQINSGDVPKKVDLVFSAPPVAGRESFFDMPEYNDMDFDAWGVIMKDALSAAWKLLVDDGFMVVQLNNTAGSKIRYVEALHDIVDAFTGVEYIGMIASGKMKGPDILTWCWKKINN